MRILVRVFAVCLSAVAYFFFLLLLISMPFFMLKALDNSNGENSSLLIMILTGTSYFGIVGGMRFALGCEKWTSVFYWTTLLGAGLLAIGACGEIASISQNSNFSMIGEIAMISAHIGLVPLLLLWLMLAPLSYLTQNHFFMRITHRAIRKCKHQIESYFGFTPWPFNKIADRYDFRQALTVQVGLLPIFLGIVCTTLALCVLITGFIPMWIAEQIRRILTPENPVFTDLLAYGVSIVTLAILLM